MQSKSLRLSFCAFALAIATSAFAQDDFDEDAPVIKAPKRTTAAIKVPTVTISGVVTDFATKQPLAGARLQAYGDNRFTGMTDAEGKFTMKVPTFATSLYVTAPKFISQQVSIRSNDEKQKVEIKMINNNFGEMYGESEIITAQNSIIARGGDIVIDNEISSRLGADVRTIMHSGNPESGAAMFIRGINSLNASSQPLVIVDGVEVDMQRDRASLHEGDIFNFLSTISPEDIDKVTVLKNATALYGARGANGVILIDTKRGHSMATRIDARISAGFALMPSTQKVMNADQYRNYAAEQLGTVREVQQAISVLDPLKFSFLENNPNAIDYQTYHNNTNWSDQIYRTAVTQNYSINVQGGDDIGMYHLSVGYVSAQKNIKKADFDRINVRFNTDINILYNLKVKFDISFSKTNTMLFDDGFASNISAMPITSPANLALLKSPVLSVNQYNPTIKAFTSLLSNYDDLYSALGNEYSLSNPVALMDKGEGERKNKNESTYFNVAFQPTYEINKHLKVSTHFSYYLNRNSQAYYRPEYGVAPFVVENLGTINKGVGSIFTNETNILSNTFINWNNKYNAHSISATGGFRINFFNYYNSNLSTQYQDRDGQDKNPALHSTDKYYTTVDGVDDSWRNIQWYANVDYNYANKYYATVSVLAEANSRFGAKAKGGIYGCGTPWAIFPSVQFGWVMSNEKWFPKNGIVNHMRLTAGFDMSGNDGISNYAAYNAFSSVHYNKRMIGMQLTNIGNDEVKWENTTKWNFGIHTNLINNRLSLGFDYFVHNTNDLLALKSFDNPIGGINNYWVNDGKLTNTGFEFSLNYKPIVRKNWNMEIGATVGNYKTEITHLTDGAYTASVYGDNNLLFAEGYAPGVFYGYKTHDHVFSTTAEAASAGLPHVNNRGEETTNLYYVDKSGAKVDFEAGDVWFVDRNGDGCIDEKDKAVIGNPNPDIYGNIYASLKYKRFSFDLSFNYSVGNDIYNYQRSILNSGSTLYNQQVAEIGRWRYEGQVSELPKATFGDPKGNNRFSDRWIEDGSYLRLKRFAVTYQIPIPESWQGWLQGISVWGEANNLFTLTKYKGNDPEFSVSNNQFYQGIDAGLVPQTRSFLFGVKINL